MRIDCPVCGTRDLREFVMFGDASVVRPDDDEASADPQARFDAFYAATYLRANPAGAHHEHWFHAAGCQRWLIVARNTLDHNVTGVTLAQHRAAAAAPMAAAAAAPVASSAAPPIDTPMPAPAATPATTHVTGL